MQPTALRTRIVMLGIVGLLVVGATSTPAAGQDKSGVRPSVLSLPSGPGSIEGLGESFEPQLNTGTATHSVPLTVPAGRAGFAPQLSLSYNSGYGNGVFGLGWRLSIPSLERQTDKGLPYYTEWPTPDGVDNDHDGTSDEFDELDTFVYSNGEELVPTPEGYFRFENEAEFVRFERSGPGWIAVRRDGVVLKLGLTVDSRIEGDVHGVPGNVFRWHLNEMSDLNGNRIQLNWTTLCGPDGHPCQVGETTATQQRYLSSIHYNPEDGSGMRVEFVYESRDDLISDYRPRFHLRTDYRCSEIRMSAGGQAARTYRLEYAPVIDERPLSLLASVTVVGRDGSSELPPAELSYVAFDGASASATSMPNAPALVIFDPAIDLLDVDGDALPDILDTRAQGHVYYLNLGPDAGGAVQWSSANFMTQPLSLILSSGVWLSDVDGNGRTDLIADFMDHSEYYRVAEDAGGGLFWDFGGFVSGQQFLLSDPNLRLIDLNNDKLIDAMKTSAGVFSGWLNLEQGQWSSTFSEIAPAPGLSFGLQDIRLADMNGDRLQDIVRLSDGVCVYYPNIGLAEFGTAVVMQNPPFGVIDETHLLLLDANGDGRSDVVYESGGATKVWVNLGLDSTDPLVGQLAAPFTVLGPVTTTSTVFRVADVNGNGSQDILWNTPGAGPDTWVFVDFAAVEQPHQLKTITNGIGATTTIHYSTTTSEAIRDRNAGNPWPVGVPFPVPVVAQVQVQDGRDPHVYTSSYEYHDGYYDGGEREFRGFAGADAAAIGDLAEGAPTLVTSHIFDTGETDEALKGKLLSTEAKTDAGEVFYTETAAWSTRTIDTGVPGDDREVVFAYPASKVRDIIEKNVGSPTQLQWSYDYDNFGNMTVQTEYGRVEPPQGLTAWDDERVTVRTYSAAYPTGLSNWILDRLIEEEIQDDVGTVFARSRHFYDDETFSGTNLGSVTAGNLTMTRAWHDPADLPGGYVTSIRNRYDTFGNITSIYDPLWAGPSAHYREIAYDPTFNTFPVTETIYTDNPDAVGDATLVFEADYDVGFGTMTSSIGPNGFETAYGYDTFGRLTSIVKPLDSTLHPTVEYDYVLAHDFGGGVFINWVETHKREQAGQPGTVNSRKFFDGLSRHVMTRAAGETPQQVVVTDTVQFNARTTPWKQYLPYFETVPNGDLGFQEPTFNSGFTEHQYDAIGRDIVVFQPIAPGAEEREFSRTTYEPLALEIEDEEQTKPESPHFGAATCHTSDGLLHDEGKGRLRLVEEITTLNDDGSYSATLHTWTTTYVYDLLDDLLGYVDSQDNAKFIEYDGLGRNTFSNDPDSGYTWYAYDDVGNVLRTRDARGHEIAYQYDGANRLLAEWYATAAERSGGGLTPGAVWINPGPVPDRVPDVSYHYDYPAGPIEVGDSTFRTPPEILVDVILETEPPDPAYDLNDDGAIDVADVVIAVDRYGPPDGGSGPGDGEIAVSRNTAGRLAWVRDQSGQEHNSYDERGREEWTIKRIDRSPPEYPVVFRTTYAYDSMDRVTIHEYPDDTLASFVFDSRGLLEAIPGVISGIDYDPLGQLTTVHYDFGFSTVNGYDYRLRLSNRTSTRDSDGVQLQNLSYKYDAVSNVTSIVDNRTNENLDQLGFELGIDPVDAQAFRASQGFQYDSLYRLIEASIPSAGGTVTYAYDRIGNLLRKQSGIPDPTTDLGEMAYGGSALGSGNPGAWGRLGRGPTDPPGPHALTLVERGNDDASEQSLTYDNSGNVNDLGDAQLFFDHKNRLTDYSVGTDAGVYVYDFGDSRKRKAVTINGAVDTALYIDKHSEVRAGTVSNYLYLTTNRIARFGTNQSSYLLDHLGSTTLALNSSADVIEQYSYYPFGSERLGAMTSSTRASDYRFTGKESDSESTLQYFEARYLAGPLGRFVSVDPLYSEDGRPHATDDDPFVDLRDPQRLNLYSYAGGNPVNFLDPSGKSKQKTDADTYAKNRQNQNRFLAKEPTTPRRGGIVDRTVLFSETQVAAPAGRGGLRGVGGVLGLAIDHLNFLGQYKEMANDWNSPQGKADRIVRRAIREFGYKPEAVWSKPGSSIISDLEERSFESIMREIKPEEYAKKDREFLDKFRAVASPNRTNQPRPEPVRLSGPEQ